MKMNKKILIGCLTILAIVLGIIGVFKLNFNNEDKTVDNGNNNIMNQENNDSHDIAVIYFSATGTTRKVTTSLNSKLNSDLIEIAPKNKYTSSDLDYNDTNSRVSKEHNDSSTRPEIANDIDISKYNKIYLGYPIWWNDAPKIIYTFLDNYDLSSKKLYLFSTSAGSGIEASVNNIKRYNSNLNILNSKRFGSNFSDRELTEFINND